MVIKINLMSGQLIAGGFGDRSETNSVRKKIESQIKRIIDLVWAGYSIRIANVETHH